MLLISRSTSPQALIFARNARTFAYRAELTSWGERSVPGFQGSPHIRDKPVEDWKQHVVYLKLIAHISIYNNGEYLAVVRSTTTLYIVHRCQIHTEDLRPQHSPAYLPKATPQILRHSPLLSSRVGWKSMKRSTELLIRDLDKFAVNSSIYLYIYTYKIIESETEQLVSNWYVTRTHDRTDKSSGGAPLN